jgi:hypothetical protein
MCRKLVRVSTTVGTLRRCIERAGNVAEGHAKRAEKEASREVCAVEERPLPENLGVTF